MTQTADLQAFGTPSLSGVRIALLLSKWTRKSLLESFARPLQTALGKFDYVDRDAIPSSNPFKFEYCVADDSELETLLTLQRLHLSYHPWEIILLHEHHDSQGDNLGNFSSFLRRTMQMHHIGSAESMHAVIVSRNAISEKSRSEYCNVTKSSGAHICFVESVDRVLSEWVSPNAHASVYAESVSILCELAKRLRNLIDSTMSRVFSGNSLMFPTQPDAATKENTLLPAAASKASQVIYGSEGNAAHRRKVVFEARLRKQKADIALMRGDVDLCLTLIGSAIEVFRQQGDHLLVATCTELQASALQRWCMNNLGAPGGGEAEVLPEGTTPTESMIVATAGDNIPSIKVAREENLFVAAQSARLAMKIAVPHVVESCVKEGMGTRRGSAFTNLFNERDRTTLHLPHASESNIVQSSAQGSKLDKPRRGSQAVVYETSLSVILSAAIVKYKEAQVIYDERKDNPVLSLWVRGHICEILHILGDRAGLVEMASNICSDSHQVRLNEAVGMLESLASLLTAMGACRKANYLRLKSMCLLCETATFLTVTQPSVCSSLWNEAFTIGVNLAGAYHLSFVRCYLNVQKYSSRCAQNAAVRAALKGIHRLQSAFPRNRGNSLTRKEQTPYGTANMNEVVYRRHPLGVIPGYSTDSFQGHDSALHILCKHWAGVKLLRDGNLTDGVSWPALQSGILDRLRRAADKSGMKAELLIFAYASLLLLYPAFDQKTQTAIFKLISNKVTGLAEMRDRESDWDVSPSITVKSTEKQDQSSVFSHLSKHPDVPCLVIRRVSGSSQCVVGPPGARRSTPNGPSTNDNDRAWGNSASSDACYAIFGGICGGSAPFVPLLLDIVINHDGRNGEKRSQHVVLPNMPQRRGNRRKIDAAAAHDGNPETAQFLHNPWAVDSESLDLEFSSSYWCVNEPHSVTVCMQNPLLCDVVLDHVRLLTVGAHLECHPATVLIPASGNQMVAFELCVVPREEGSIAITGIAYKFAKVETCQVLLRDSAALAECLFPDSLNVPIDIVKVENTLKSAGIASVTAISFEPKLQVAINTRDDILSALGAVAEEKAFLCGVEENVTAYQLLLSHSFCLTVENISEIPVSSLRMTARVGEESFEDVTVAAHDPQKNDGIPAFQVEYQGRANTCRGLMVYHLQNGGSKPRRLIPTLNSAGMPGWTRWFLAGFEKPYLGSLEKLMCVFVASGECVSSSCFVSVRLAYWHTLAEKSFLREAHFPLRFEKNVWEIPRHTLKCISNSPGSKETDTSHQSSAGRDATGDCSFRCISTTDFIKVFFKTDDEWKGLKSQTIILESGTQRSLRITAISTHPCKSTLNIVQRLGPDEMLEKKGLVIFGDLQKTLRKVRKGASVHGLRACSIDVDVMGIGIGTYRLSMALKCGDKTLASEYITCVI